MLRREASLSSLIAGGGGRRRWSMVLANAAGQTISSMNSSRVPTMFLQRGPRTQPCFEQRHTQKRSASVPNWSPPHPKRCLDSVAKAPRETSNAPPASPIWTWATTRGDSSSCEPTAAHSTGSYSRGSLGSMRACMCVCCWGRAAATWLPPRRRACRPRVAVAGSPTRSITAWAWRRAAGSGGRAGGRGKRQGQQG